MMKRKQSVSLLEPGNYRSLEPVHPTTNSSGHNDAPEPKPEGPVVELEGGAIPLGIALVILAALDKDTAAMAQMQVDPAEVRNALVNAAKRVLDEPIIA